ncbi:MAG TPA: 3'-5' exonuclease, partial [Tepidisphaeraceae bacterium]|nr:3'-5' exonuclease [Tepidisphaeraceae bacterium]
ECQDINPIQDAILRLVSTEAHSKRNVECVSNLFSVGDVKQSIYGFRLANPAQFIARSDELDIVGKAEPDRGALILLRENFRSRGQLLDAVNEIFVRLMTRDSAGIDYDDTHKLREGRAHGIAPGGFTGKPIELHVIDDDSTDHDDDSHDAESDLGASETEAQLIAHRIHRLMGWIGDKPALVLDETDPTLQAHRPIELGDIAILLRSARGTAGALASHLRRRGVPVHVENASGFFEAIEVLDMLSLLRVADNSTRDIPLAALIRSPFSGVSQPESLMARIRLATPDVPFHEAIRGQKDSTSLRDFFNQIEEWRSILRDERLDRAIERIVEETGYMNWLSGLPDGAQRIANVQELVRRARTFAAFERQGVSRFVQFLTELEQEQDLDLPAAASQSRDVVRIMTVHKSKGLEFPVVIVPNLGRKRNRLSLAAPVLIDREAGLGIHAYEAERHVRYPSLFHRLVARAHDQREVAEELRILYVALTRAREHLILIGTGKKTEQWREDWADHTGPLPAEKIRSAQTMLDRLGPVAEMIHRDAPGNIEITRYSLGEIASLQPALIDTDLPSALSNLARFEPIEPAPTIPKDLQDSFDRINQRYPFEMLTAVSSANAVTDFKKPTARARLTHLARPHFTLDTSKLNAADRGTATHAAFQHLDYHKLANADEIRAQLAKLLDRQILRESEVAAIDIESLLWFAQTELCRSMIAPNVRLLRELPVYMAMPTGVADSPMDQLLLRGRIDAVMIEPDGTATVIDFKSDRLNEADVDARAEQYRSQLALYRQAMTRMSGREARAKLV